MTVSAHSRLSRHAQTRLQQRAIPSIVVSLLQEYGASMRHAGADMLFMDKAARRQIERDWGGSRNLRLLEPFLNAYAVRGDDGTIITTAHRTRRLKRP